jgi:hypothetical protein
MAKSYSSTKSRRGSSSRIKSTAVLEANEVAQAAAEASNTRRFRDVVFEDAPVADLDTL